MVITLALIMLVCVIATHSPYVVIMLAVYVTIGELDHRWSRSTHAASIMHNTQDHKP